MFICPIQYFYDIFVSQSTISQSAVSQSTVSFRFVSESTLSQFKSRQSPAMTGSSKSNQEVSNRIQMILQAIGPASCLS